MQLCNLLLPTTVLCFMAIDAKRQKLAAPVHCIIDVDNNDGMHNFGNLVPVAIAGPGSLNTSVVTKVSANTSAVARVSAMTPAKNTSESLLAVVDSHLLLETGKNLNFDVQAGIEKNIGGVNPNNMDVVAMSQGTPPKDTSGNMYAYEKPQSKVMSNVVSNEAGTQLFGVEGNDSDK